MMTSAPKSAQIRRWRMRAEECRTLADNITNQQARASLLSVAEGYEGLADRTDVGLPATPETHSQNGP